METKPRTSQARVALAPTQLAGWLSGVAVVVAALVVYSNSFHVPYVFDDLPAIRDNATIRHLGSALVPPRASGLPVSGRPLVNFSLALNQAMSGDHVASYHAFNLLVHIFGGLALLGIVRRTLLGPVLRDKYGAVARVVALITSLLWVVHPLQTESVTYLVQRAESLMGLCYLLTLYCFIRFTEPGAAKIWSAGCVVACLLGMAAKEVMVSAPVIVLLYDRTFVTGTFREAWRRHAWLHAGLALTWVVLLGLVADTAGRGGTAGFGTGVSWWTYAETQFVAILQYLALSVWPSTLTLDYGTRLVTDPVLVIPSALAVGALGIGSLVALRRTPLLGFCGAWFFAILAPSSSLLPVATQTFAEHRMYLSLAAALVVAFVALYHALGRQAVAVVAVAAAALGARTIARNADYRTAITIWNDTIAKQPDNPRAHCNLGEALFVAGNRTGAIAEYNVALSLSPDYADAHFNLANALMDAGDFAAAIPHYEAALQNHPDHARAQHNLANALADAGRIAEAAVHYEAAVRLAPERGDAWCDWGNALTRAGRTQEALSRYEASVRAEPGFAVGHNNLANALAQSGRITEAVSHYEQALRLQPDYAEAHTNFANTLLQADRPRDAIRHYEAALRLQPNRPEGHNNLGMALAEAGDLPAARAQFEEALRLRPDFTPARENLLRARAMNP